MATGKIFYVNLFRKLSTGRPHFLSTCNVHINSKPNNQGVLPDHNYLPLFLIYQLVICVISVQGMQEHRNAETRQHHLAIALYIYVTANSKLLMPPQDLHYCVARRCKEKHCMVSPDMGLRLNVTKTSCKVS